MGLGDYCVKKLTKKGGEGRLSPGHALRGNGEHIQDTTLRPEMKTATQGHPMVFNER